MTEIPPELHAADWWRTPEPIRLLVVAQGAALREQEQVLAAQQEALVRQQEEIARLSERLARVEERLGRNSLNSSKPPSSDGPHVKPRPKQVPSGRKAGGQVGHEGHGRALLPETQVDKILEVRPQACTHCGQALAGDDPAPARRQITEVPPVRPVVTEVRVHTLVCGGCGQATRGVEPPGLAQGSFGPRTQAIIGYLVGSVHLGYRRTAAVLDDLLGIELSVGTVHALAAQVSAAVAVPVAAAHAAVQQATAVNADETSWREQGHRSWLWVAVTHWVVAFCVQARRNSAAAKHLLGSHFAGILTTDRYSAYTWVNRAQRQVCWAHLRRDFAAILERPGPSAAIGQALLDASDILFARWHRVRDGTLSRQECAAQLAPIQARVGEVLREGAALTGTKTAGTCRQILTLEAALWTFLTVEGVEPTNNTAERALRSAVLWRKRSLGTQTEAGSRLVERMLTVTATLCLQRRNVLDYLTTACEAALARQTPPSLLPQEADVLTELAAA